MKKNFRILFCLVIVLAVGLFILTACNNSNSQNEDNDTIINEDNNTTITVTYHLDGGTNDKRNPNIIDKNAIANLTLFDAEKEGYTFIGWYENAQFNGERVYSFTTFKDNIDLYAKFLINQYTISFVSSETEMVVDAITQPYNTEIKKPVLESELLGYEYAFYIDETCEKEYEFNTMPAKNLTLYIKRKIKNEMSNFIFNSTHTTCEIIGLIDAEISSIFVPEYVTEIALGAFAGCKNLVSITIPFIGNKKNLKYASPSTSLGFIFGKNEYEGSERVHQKLEYAPDGYVYKSAFYYLPKSLKKVVVTGGNVLYGAFYGCSNLNSILLSDNVNIIDTGAFKDCPNLSYNEYDNACYIGSESNPYMVLVKSVDEQCIACNIHEEARIICDDAFNSKDLRSIIIPSKITSIGAYAFYNCNNLSYVEVSESVMYIGENAFLKTSWYENQSDGLIYLGKVAYKFKGIMGNETFIDIKPGTKSIAGKAFYDCDGLVQITIPNSVERIGYRAFYSCNDLKDIVLSEGVKVVERLAFELCTHLSNISLSENVEFVGGLAFKTCDRLHKINITDLSKWCNIIFNQDNSVSRFDSVSLYLNNEIITDIIIPNGLSSILDYSFNGINANSIVIPEGVKQIGESAFSNCEVNTIVIPISVININHCAFYSCYGIDFIYEGTMEQWINIKKDSWWAAFSGELTIHCLDGDIAP